MRLNDIQQCFAQTITLPETLDRGDFRAIFREGENVALENRMKIYRNNVIVTLSNALMAALPMTRRLVGEDFLRRAARTYAATHMPAEGNLNLYGMDFPDFLRSYQPASALPWLCDMTRLECAWERAYYAPDDEPLSPARLGALPEDALPGLRLKMRGSVSLLASDYPLDEIVDFCRAENPQDTLDISGKSCHLLVFRPLLTVELRKLDKGAFAFLQCLRMNGSIAEAARTAIGEDPAFDLAAVLQKYLQAGIFTDFSLSG